MCSIEKMEDGKTYHIVVGEELMKKLDDQIAMFARDVVETGFTDNAMDVLEVAMQCLGRNLADAIREEEERDI